MNNIQGVLFDADGTLIDTYDIILTSMRYAVNDVLGCSLDDAELMAGVGTPLYDQMLHFTGGDAARATEITQIYRDHNDGVHDARIRAFGDTKAALERFQAAGIPMGVVTSKRHAMAQRGLERAVSQTTSNSSSAMTIGPSISRPPAPFCEAASFWAWRRNAVFTWATVPSTSKLATLLAALPPPLSGACSHARSWRPNVPRSCAIR